MSGKIQCTRHNSHKVFNVRHTLFNHKRSISGPVMCFRSDLVCTQPQCCVTGLFRHIYCAVVPTCSSMPVRHHNYWSGTKPVNMLLVLKCGLQKPAVVCSQSHSCILTCPRAQNCQSEQLIRDNIWRAATDMRSTVLYTDTTNHTWQSNKTDAFISAFAVNPREKHSCGSNSRTLATPRSWLWFPRNVWADKMHTFNAI